MPKEISKNRKSEVISHLILGKPYEEIFKITGVSTSSIRNIVRDLETSFGKDDVSLLINFAKSLKKHNLSVIEALNGIRIFSILKSLNCSEEYVAEFLNSVVSQCKSQNLSPDDLVEYSAKLFELSQLTDIPLEKLENHNSLLVEKIKTFDDSIIRLNKEEKEVKTRLDEALRHENTTTQLLNDYSAIKKRLGEFNIDIGDLDLLVSMLKESSRLDFDPHKVIQYIKKEFSFETRIDSLQKDVDDLNNTVQQKQNELTRIQRDIDELKLQKEQLVKQNDSLQEQIKFSKETTLSALDEIKNSSILSITESTKSAKDSIVSSNETTQKEMKSITSTAKNNFEEITTDFESLLSKVSEASTELGKMQALMPLYQMITQFKGDTISVYISLLSMFDSLLIWEKTHRAPIGVLNHITHIQNLLREYLAKQQSHR